MLENISHLLAVLAGGADDTCSSLPLLSCNMISIYIGGL